MRLPRELPPENLDAFSPEPDSFDTDAGTLVWNLCQPQDALVPGAQRLLSFRVQAGGIPGDKPLPLFADAEVTSAWDTNPANNRDSTTVTVVETGQPAQFDLAHVQDALTRRSEIIAGEIVPIAEAGEVFQYKLRIFNLGPGTARHFTLRDSIPDILRPDFRQRLPQSRSQAFGDSIFVWEFDSLAAGFADSVLFQAEVPLASPDLPASLFSGSRVEAPGDINPANDYDSTRVRIGASGSFIDRNVFNPEQDDPLVVRFGLPAPSHVRIDVYDLAGTHIINLANDGYPAGIHAVHWNGRARNGLIAGSGLYMITIETQFYKDWKKVIIVR